MKVAGFDWDSGNWPKCGKHGVSQAEIEQVMLGSPAVMADPHPNELRMRAIGKTQAKRYVFLVFTIRVQDEQHKIRPISARYMHQKEIDHYERETKNHAAAAKR
ncbi:BrnT family toxin [Allopusillimonas soli]|uniref:BrnT family toxin n=1 Tax=Allopusillimonas soli TaxID=659016 RepID=A0A853FBK7_9BURK|nr:BrnT family toxin [Allopusillimonas soli]NYT35456.1 BrnT family toxin [Allopusillimonas soli]TEA75871.1 BrnT family toxin [Allopusillimonas soli]